MNFPENNKNTIIIISAVKRNVISFFIQLFIFILILITLCIQNKYNYNDLAQIISESEVHIIGSNSFIYKTSYKNCSGLIITISILLIIFFNAILIDNFRLFLNHDGYLMPQKRKFNLYLIIAFIILSIIIHFIPKFLQNEYYIILNKISEKKREEQASQCKKNRWQLAMCCEKYVSIYPYLKTNETEFLSQDMFINENLISEIVKCPNDGTYSIMLYKTSAEEMRRINFGVDIYQGCKGYILQAYNAKCSYHSKDMSYEVK